MSRARHKIPTGLTVEDRLFSYGAISLTTRQFLLLLGGAAIGYGGVWQGWSGLPALPRVGIAVVPLLLAAVVALARPDGRPLESWVFVLLRHWSRPRVAVWRPRPPRPDDWRPVGPDWAELPATGGATGTADAHGGRGDAAAGAGGAAMSPTVLSLVVLLVAALGFLLLRRGGRAGRATIQGTHLAIEAIAEGIVTFAGGRRRAVLAVGSLNFATLGEAKQREVVTGYAAALDSLTFPVQVLARLTPPDLAAYLAARDARAAGEPHERLRRVARDRNAFVRRLADGRAFIDRRFYLVVPADDPRPTALPRRRDTAEGAGGGGDGATAARQLAARCDDLIRQLGRCGLTARRLDDAELAALHFACWCPDLAAIEQLGRELRDGDLVVARERARSNPRREREVA